MDIELVNINDRGAGYAVVHRDDGTTYGMQFSGAPIGSRAELIEHLSDKAVAIEEKEAAELIPAAPIPMDIRSLVSGKQRAPVVRKPKQE